MRPANYILTVALAIAAIAASFAAGANGHETFTSQSHGYTVRYPSSWHPQIVSDVFYIENFLPSKAVRAVRLPAGGAGIKILVPSQVIKEGQKKPRDVKEWVAIGAAHDKPLSTETVELSDGKRKLTVTEVKTRCCAVAPYQEAIDWYFQVDGHLFLATLFYWEDDINALKLRETLKGVVFSLRVTATGEPC